PVAPFFNRWFPNPFYHPGEEKIYVETLRQYLGIDHGWQVPLQLTLQGGFVGGLTGPMFLLAPLALLAWREPHARRLLAAAAVCLIPAWFNTGTRFLIPAMPFVALAMGLALGRTRGVLPALAAFQALAAWPGVLSMYCDPYAWRIAAIPVKAALREEPEAKFIEARIGDYALKDVIEQNVPRNGKVFSFAGRPEAYIDRTIVVSYESTLGNLAQETLFAVESKPNFRERYRFLPVRTGGVRLVETAAADFYWTASEIRIYSEGRELPRAPAWRLAAWPNGWEVQLAFDNDYATRWSTWENMRPRSRVEIEFGREETIDEVAVECAHVREAHVQVEVSRGDGQWIPLTDTQQGEPIEPPTGLRRAATAELKALGIGFLLINSDDHLAQDVNKYAKFWGVALLAEKNGTRFYRID
ncbi:MAG TPA: discoidin domain-containing protein, partial [Bryobacteraceae bacterium]